MTQQLEFTGERVVPNNTCHALTMAEHLIRYSLAAKYAKVGAILDVACGSGYGLKIMGMLGANKFGADLSPEAVAYAKEFNGQGKFEVVDFELENLKHFFPNVDLVTSFETIEHLANPNLFLTGIKTVLKDNGKFIYSIPLANPSKYHKVVYTFESALELINEFFDHEEIFVQESLELVNFTRMQGNVNNLNKRGIFIVGVCHKKI